MSKAWKGVLAAGALFVSACNGWPTTLPYQQAVHKPEHYPTYSRVDATAVPMFTAGNHRYMVMPTPANVRGSRTTNVASGGGTTVFALEGDEAPYATLFARGQDGRVRTVAAID